MHGYHPHPRQALKPFLRHQLLAMGTCFIPNAGSLSHFLLAASRRYSQRCVAALASAEGETVKGADWTHWMLHEQIHQGSTSLGLNGSMGANR
jgi:hypothetical protein